MNFIVIFRDKIIYYWEEDKNSLWYSSTYYAQCLLEVAKLKETKLYLSN
jgi:hypothetical protein